jgi:hypothetical protein
LEFRGHGCRGCGSALSVEPLDIVRVFVPIFLTLLAGGCSRSTSPRSEGVRLVVTEVRVLDASNVVAIARRAIATNDTWITQAEFETPRRQSNGLGWSILVWRLPKTYGGFRLIEIDDTGKVTKYSRGM